MKPFKERRITHIQAKLRKILLFSKAFKDLFGGEKVHLFFHEVFQSFIWS